MYSHIYIYVFIYVYIRGDVGVYRDNGKRKQKLSLGFVGARFTWAPKYVEIIASFLWGS